jgi:hypothetical protein
MKVFRGCRLQRPGPRGKSYEMDCKVTVAADEQAREERLGVPLHLHQQIGCKRPLLRRFGTHFGVLKGIPPRREPPAERLVHCSSSEGMPAG